MVTLVETKRTHVNKHNFLIQSNLAKQRQRWKLSKFSPEVKHNNINLTNLYGPNKDIPSFFEALKTVEQ